MTQLQLGMKKACVTFARSLADEGVMSLQRLRLQPSAKAHALLQKAGMKDLQVEAVLQAFCAQAKEQAAAAQQKVHTMLRQRISNVFAGAIPDAFDCRLLKLLLPKRRRRGQLQPRKRCTRCCASEFQILCETRANRLRKLLPSKRNSRQQGLILDHSLLRTNML